MNIFTMFHILDPHFKIAKVNLTHTEKRLIIMGRILNYKLKIEDECETQTFTFFGFHYCNRFMDDVNYHTVEASSLNYGNSFAMDPTPHYFIINVLFIFFTIFSQKNHIYITIC